MNKQAKIPPTKHPTNTGAQIRRVINGCAVTINFAPKADSIIPEIKRMMLSGVAKT